MTQSELKRVASIGAELGAAKAEIEALREQVKVLQSGANSWQSGYDKGRNDGGKHRKGEVEQLRQHKNDYMDAAEATRKALLAEIESLRNGLKNARYRIEQGRVWNGMGWTLTGLHAHQQQKALDEIEAALSQQAEPTDTFTAVDMATAAAQGFRDGRAAVEQDTAQGERDFSPDHTLFSEIRCSMPVNDDGEETRYIINEQQLQRIRALEFNRPAQTEQQPCEAEEWRSVDGYEGLYSVSSLGRLRSDRTGKYLSLNSRVASGYVKADMHKDGEKKQTTVHRLVAQAFLERPEGADEVNHINGDKLDNRVSNLAWCSRRENVNHGYYELGHLVHRVKAIPIEGNGPELVFASIEQAVANGFHSGGIYTCLGQPHRYHLGYYWRSLKDAAPIAQTAPQGKFRMGDLVKKSTGSEWEGLVVGWYSTEQTPEGYAVESSAHRNSVQIYPAKALEAVE